MSSGWCCKRKHILPMQERHRPVAVGNTRSRLSCYGTARNQDRNPMQANHYLCNDTYMCCTSPRRCLLWPTQIGRWDYLIDQLLSLGWSTTILYEIRVDGYNSRRGQSSDIRQRDTRSQLSAGAQVILQPMTVEQRELMITRLWCCRPAADVVWSNKLYFLLQKCLGILFCEKIKKIA